MRHHLPAGTPDAYTDELGIYNGRGGRKFNPIVSRKKEHRDSGPGKAGSDG
jgi:hypothetical protein